MAVYTEGTIAGYRDNGGTPKMQVGMQLFGLPYQFLPSVDQRNPAVSKKLGRKFIENIVLDSSIVTIIPGEPRYLPAVSNKAAFTNALLSAANGNFSELRTLSGYRTSELRLYDFQSAYLKYFQYVNVLCRVAAGYLELNNPDGFTINGARVNFLNFDWKNYRWNEKNYHTVIGKLAGAGGGIISRIIQTGSRLLGATKSSTSSMFSDPTAGSSNDELDSSENILKSTSFIQFYADADTSRGSESVSNNTQQSAFKQLLDQGSQAMKDVAFMANSGGVDTDKLGKLGESAMSEIEKALGGDGGGTVNGAIGGIMSRILSTGKSVIKGENIMMPDIWSGSSNSKSYSLEFKFRAMYGNRLSNFIDAIVPTLFCVGLAYPRGTTANSYGSPPLVKVYKRGDWTVNMGMVNSIEISKNEAVDAFSVDSVPMDITVTMGITDLYTDVALTPPGNIRLFATNSSLIDFIGTICGLDLVEPQLAKKVSTLWNMTLSGIRDIPDTAMGKVTESFERAIVAFTGL